jgi:hypothetical protein
VILCDTEWSFHKREKITSQNNIFPPFFCSENADKPIFDHGIVEAVNPLAELVVVVARLA